MGILLWVASGAARESTPLPTPWRNPGQVFRNYFEISMRRAWRRCIHALWVGRALRCAPALAGFLSGCPHRAAGKGLPALPLRFMKSEVFQALDTYWDHEPTHPWRGALRRARREGDLRAAPRDRRPPSKAWFMGSRHGSRTAHWDHEPGVEWRRSRRRGGLVWSAAA